MIKKIQNFQNSKWLHPTLLFIVAGLLFLLFTSRIGLFNDDWYLVFDGHAQGSGIFHEVFKSDRPARAYFFEAAYSVFGDHIIYYKITSFIFRYLSVIAFYWALTLIWKKKRNINFLASLIFLIYPGFLGLVVSIDYMTHFISLGLVMLSCAFTVYAIQASSLSKKIILGIFANFLGWIYLGLLEYYIGMEFLRIIFIYLVITRSSKEKFIQKVANTIVAWLPFALIPVGFLGWRLFFFENTRQATDLGVQLSGLFSSPVYTVLWWIANLITGYLNSALFAWALPFYETMKMLRLKELLFVFGITTGLVAFLLLMMNNDWKVGDDQNEILELNDSNWRKHSIYGGGLAIIAAILPIIIVNRDINLNGLARYTVAAAPGVAMLLTALINNLASQRVRLGTVGVMLFIASAAHFGNAISYANQSEGISNFWWQVSWRAPQIEPGTTLTTLYPLTAVSEDYFIWGPANLIYYPERQDANPVKIQLPSIILQDNNLPSILAQTGDSEYSKRGNLVHTDNRSLLVLAQGSPDNCVRILDDAAPELSAIDEQRIMLVSPFSKKDRIVVDEQPAYPPELIFGPEPEHTWCYYYEKASLARQRQDWNEVIQLMVQADQNDYGPLDRIEWMPLLQAYVATGQEDKLAPYVSIMMDDRFVNSQICPLLEKVAAETRPEDLDMKSFLEETFCK